MGTYAGILWTYTVSALVFAVVGIYDLCAKKQINFWMEFREPVRDVQSYNRAVGKLNLGFAAVLELIGVCNWLLAPSLPSGMFGIVGPFGMLIIRWLHEKIKIYYKYK